MPLDLTGYYDTNGQLTEAGRRAMMTDQQNQQNMPPGAQTPAPMAPPPSYTNGNHFAGTNVPMSDAAYALLSQNGTRPIAQDRDVQGTGGVGQSLANAGRFELSHVGDIVKGLADQPSRLVFGFDPLVGQRAANAVSGDNNAPLVNQMGGATSQQIRDYEARHGTNSAGAAQSLHNAAAGTAAVIAAGTLANGGLGGGNGAGATPQMTPYRGGANLDFVSQGAPAAAQGGAGAGAALPEIVVTGTAPAAGGGAGGAIAAGAGAAAGGAAAASSGGGSSSGSSSGKSSGESNGNSWQKFMKNLGGSLNNQGQEQDAHLTELAKASPPPRVSLGQNLTADQYAQLLKRAENEPPPSLGGAPMPVPGLQLA